MRLFKDSEKMTRNKIEFFQGENIVFQLYSNESVRLDEWYFELSLIKGSYVVKIRKEDCDITEDGRVVVNIANSSNMPTGVYDIELMIKKKEVVKIAVAENVFLIKESTYGKC